MCFSKNSQRYAILQKWACYNFHSISPCAKESYLLEPVQHFVRSGFKNTFLNKPTLFEIDMSVIYCVSLWRFFLFSLKSCLDKISQASSWSKPKREPLNPLSLPICGPMMLSGLQEFWMDWLPIYMPMNLCSLH